MNFLLLFYYKRSEALMTFNGSYGTTNCENNPGFVFAFHITIKGKDCETKGWHFIVSDLFSVKLLLSDHLAGHLVSLTLQDVWKVHSQSWYYWSDMSKGMNMLIYIRGRFLHKMWIFKTNPTRQQHRQIITQINLNIKWDKLKIKKSQIFQQNP